MRLCRHRVPQEDTWGMTEPYTVHTGKNLSTTTVYLWTLPFLVIILYNYTCVSCSKEHSNLTLVLNTRSLDGTFTDLTFLWMNIGLHVCVLVELPLFRRSCMSSFLIVMTCPNNVNKTFASDLVP